MLFRCLPLRFTAIGWSLNNLSGNTALLIRIVFDEKNQNEVAENFRLQMPNNAVEHRALQTNYSIVYKKQLIIRYFTWTTDYTYINTNSAFLKVFLYLCYRVVNNSTDIWLFFFLIHFYGKLLKISSNVCTRYTRASVCMCVCLCVRVCVLKYTNTRYLNGDISSFLESRALFDQLSKYSLRQKKNILITDGKWLFTEICRLIIMLLEKKTTV